MIMTGQLSSIISRIVVHSWVFPKCSSNSLSFKIFEIRAAGPLNFNKCWSDSSLLNLKTIPTIPLNVLKDAHFCPLRLEKIHKRKESFILLDFKFVSHFSLFISFS